MTLPFMITVSAYGGFAAYASTTKKLAAQNATIVTTITVDNLEIASIVYFPCKLS